MTAFSVVIVNNISIDTVFKNLWFIITLNVDHFVNLQHIPEGNLGSVAFDGNPFFGRICLYNVAIGPECNLVEVTTGDKSRT